MKLETYLNRVGFRGTPRVDAATLIALHRGHLLNIPYENFDVQLGRPVDFDVAHIFAKLVTQRRGGWCYEMNGLLGWALQTIGFKVTRMAGGVGRAQSGDVTIGNHLVLRVDLDRTYIADVGFGDGLLEAVPLAPGKIRQRDSDFSLQQLGDDWWRFHNDQRGGAPSFDFQLRVADAALLAEKCAFLQQDAQSIFVQNALCFRQFKDGIALLRGKVLIRYGVRGATQVTLPNVAAYMTALRDIFGIDLPEAQTLWPKIEARHAELAKR